MFKAQDFGMRGKYWWTQPVGTLILIAFFGYLYLPLVLGLFLLGAIFYGLKGQFQKAKAEGSDDIRSETNEPIKETDIYANQSRVGGTAISVKADLCGHPKATVSWLQRSGTKVRRGDIVMRFEVKSHRIPKMLGLTEYARQEGVVELLVSNGDEVLDKQPIYRLVVDNHIRQ